jgi:transglutaminase-like putative cysteine protease
MKLVLSLICLALSVWTAAQEKNPFVKFGKITVSDLQKTAYAVDSSASAVVLSDIGETEIDGNSKGWFSLISRRHKVVHILNKNGYHESNVEIPLYFVSDNEEKLQGVKAVTYTLEGGKVVETKMDKSNVFTEKVSKNRMLKKFTLPNIKEGCIVEYEYTVVSDFIENLDPWYFQGRSPVLWTEFNFTVPEFFIYNFLSRGYERITIRDRSDHKGNFTLRDTRSAGATDATSFSAGVTTYRWGMKNVPELKEESFTSSIQNHRSRMEFQLAGLAAPLTPRTFRSTWQELTRGLLESEGFGVNLKTANNWMGDEVKPVFASVTSSTDKARKIFYYVRDNFSSTGYGGVFLQQSLKNVFKAKKGSVQELNLLLTAMLRYAGLEADPVILSTRSHGFVFESSPIITQFNYVIVQVRDGEKVYYLDASDSRLGFGQLAAMCFNGHARVVNEEATAINLSADLLKESSLTQFIVNNDEKGNWGGSFTQINGVPGSYAKRRQYREQGRETFFSEMQKAFGFDVKFKEAKVDSLNNYEAPLTIRGELEFTNSGDELLYINPMFGEGWRKNPFAAATRNYPVEMPYAIDETVVVTMEVPNGYVIDELPKQAVVKYDEEGKNFFEYRLTHSNNTISFRSRIKIERTMFMPDEYETLREFFNFVVTKQNEQIVFKKKK